MPRKQVNCDTAQVVIPGFLWCCSMANFGVWTVDVCMPSTPVCCFSTDACSDGNTVWSAPPPGPAPDMPNPNDVPLYLSCFHSCLAVQCFYFSYKWNCASTVGCKAM